MSPTGSSPESPIRPILRVHVAAEHSADVKSTMATVSDDPHWLIYPAFEIHGRGAIEELYSRILPNPDHILLGEETKRAIEDPDVASWGPDHCLVEYDRQPDRYPLHRGFVLIFETEGDKVSAERVYLLDPAAADGVIKFFGPDFADVPGVNRLI